MSSCRECDHTNRCIDDNLCYEDGLREGREDTIENLEKKLKIWDNKVNAIPNYVWKCINELKES